MPNMEIIVGTQLSNVAAQTTLDIQGIVTSMKASGMSNSAIKDTLMADLTGGGRLFGNYRNQVKNTVKTGIGMAGSNASRSTFTKAGVDQFQWVSVGDGKVCPDCEPRHGDGDPGPGTARGPGRTRGPGPGDLDPRGPGPGDPNPHLHLNCTCLEYCTWSCTWSREVD